jgi:hypothetical protein
MNKNEVHHFYGLLSCDLILEAISWWDLPLGMLSEEKLEAGLVL